MKRICIHGLLMLVFVFAANAQTKTLAKANKYYGVKAYAEAIPLYEKALKKDANNKEILANLGDCYRLTNNVPGQLKCYEKLISSGNAQEIHKLYYGQALTESGQKENATKYFEEYLADARGKVLASSAAKAKMYTKNADAYQVALAGFNSEQNDFSAVKFMDEVIFVSSRNRTKWINTKHAWTGESFTKVYTYQSAGENYENVVKLFMGDLNSRYNDGPVCFSDEGRKIYFTRNNFGSKYKSKDGTYKLKIFEASLNYSGFDSVAIMSFVTNDDNFAHPSVSKDGNTMYFVSDMPGGFGGLDIYVCKREANGEWGGCTNLGITVNTPGNEMFPFIADDGKLYFSSNGHDGLGGLDVYEAKMKDGKPVKIYNMGEPVNSVHDDFSYWLDETGMKGFVSSNRKNGGMDDDVYNLTVLRKVSRGKNVTFVLKDKDNGEVIPNVKLQINGDTGTTNDKGEFAYLLEDDVEYTVTANNEKYFAGKDSLNTKVTEEDEFTREIKLEKDPKLSFLAFVTDVKSKQGLEGVKIEIKDLFANTVFDNTVTGTNGEYRKSLKGMKIGDKVAFSIKLSKEGYVTNELNFTTEIKQEGEIKLHEVLNMALGKVEVGMDLSKMIDLKPIYFDKGKALVRKDAAIELDKIVKVMNEYPNMVIELGAHTDCRGVAKSNLTLSDKRAKASAAYIIKKGIKKDRIAGKGYGEAKLLNACACEGKVQPKCSEEEHSVNRRTEFIITKLK